MKYLNFKKYYINGNRFSVYIHYKGKHYRISFEGSWNNLMYRLTKLSNKIYLFWRLIKTLFLIKIMKREYELIWSSDENLMRTRIVSFNSHSWFMRHFFKFGWRLRKFLSIGFGYSNSFNKNSRIYTYRIKIKKNVS
jgi:hypothetical protein